MAREDLKAAIAAAKCGERVETVDGRKHHHIATVEVNLLDWNEALQDAVDPTDDPVKLQMLKDLRRGAARAAGVDSVHVMTSQARMVMDFIPEPPAPTSTTVTTPPGTTPPAANVPDIKPLVPAQV